LERGLLAGVYEETLQMLREHRPGGWNGSIQLSGCEHIEAALSKGNGAVLWTASCTYAEIVVKKALHAAGHPIINLRSRAHPFSGTRFGQMVLNRIRNSVEDRFVLDSAWLDSSNAATALKQLWARLKENGVVSIAAIGAGDNPCRLPCLGGTLKLALGAPMLAQLARAPLLPVFTVPKPGRVYEVEIQSPLNPIGSGRIEEKLAAAFVPRLEAFIRHNPSVWRGWFSRSQWEPVPQCLNDVTQE
jgi:lauroyl/myristoyl acyltransferase